MLCMLYNKKVKMNSQNLQEYLQQRDFSRNGDIYFYNTFGHRKTETAKCRRINRETFCCTFESRAASRAYQLHHRRMINDGEISTLTTVHRWGPICHGKPHLFSTTPVFHPSGLFPFAAEQNISRCQEHGGALFSSGQQSNPR